MYLCVFVFSDSWVRVVCPFLDEIREEASIENFLSEYGRIRMENVSVCMFVCMSVYMYVCAVCMYKCTVMKKISCMYVCVRMCARMRMYTLVNIFIDVRTYIPYMLS